MIFDFTVSRGQLLFLYEFSTGSAVIPPSGSAIDSGLMAGFENAVTIREVIIGGFN